MIPINDHKNLFRDENSGAIVNGNTYEYLQYVKIKNQKKKQKNEIDDIKKELDEIKSLLKELLNGT
jgi:hypothetical protein